MKSDPFVVSLLVSRSDELSAVDEIARVSFDEPGFSIEKEIERPWARAWIARPGPLTAPPAAFLIAWHVADEIHILNIATAPSMRRRGLATVLMGAALSYATEHRARLILLEVRRSNRPAIRLYRRLGFSATSVRPGYYSDNGEDAIEMVLALDPELGQALPGRDEIQIDV
jgi:ribosomal-protein-alanine N-acetyltransferase